MGAKRFDRLGGLTLKEDRFCREYLANDGNGSAAYRAAYNVQTMSDNAIAVEASRLLDSPKVALRLEMLMDRAAVMADTSIESLIAELQTAANLAKTSNNAAAMTNAIMAKAKLAGLIVDRREDKLTVGQPADKPSLDDLLGDAPEHAEPVADSAIPSLDGEGSKLTH